MPIIPIQHSPFTVEGVDGNPSFTLSAAQVLANIGPRVQITISVPQFIIDELVKEGREVPSPQSGYGLIDTGASSTCIDVDVATELRLPVIDRVKLSSASSSESLAMYILHRWKFTNLAQCSPSKP